MIVPTIATLTEEVLGLPVSDDAITRARITVHVVLLDSVGRVALFCPNGKTGYRLPGGGIDDGETPVAAAYREVAEEIDAQIEITSAPLFQIVSVKPTENLKQNSLILTANVIEISSKGQDIKWLTLEDGIELLRTQIPRTYKKTFRQARDLTALEYIKEGKK